MANQAAGVATINSMVFTDQAHVILEVGRETSHYALGMARLGYRWGICVGIWLLAFVCAGASTVVAQEGKSSNKQAAKTAFEAGKRAYADQKYATAAAEFAESYQLSGNADLLFNIGQAYRLSGDYTQALAMYRSFLRALPNSPNAKLAQIKIDEIKIAQAPVPVQLAAPKAVASTPAPTQVPQQRQMQPRQDQQGVSDSPAAYEIPEWAPTAGLIVTGTFAVAAIATSIAASNKFNNLKDSCGQSVQGCVQSDLDGLNSRARWATAFWILTGISAVATGTVFVIDYNEKHAGFSLAGRF